MMRRTWQIIYRCWTSFSDDDGWAIASHVALSSLTSLFPFIIFVGTLAGVVGAPSLAENATQLLFETWPAEVAGPIAREIENVLTQPRTGLATLSAALAVYFASSGVEAVRVGLNRAYDVRDDRSWWWLRLESILYVVVGAIALVGFTFLVVLEPLVWSKAVKLVPDLERLSVVVTAARLGSISLILIATLFVGHKYLPAGRRRLADIWPGVALTWLLWLAFGEAFGLYLQRFSQNYISTYAGLGSVMAAIVFLYVLSAIFILGGEFNAAIAATRPGQQKTGAQEVPRAG